LNFSQQAKPGAIVFTGSSSIRLWKNIDQDMVPWPVVSRGYGGAKFTDLNLFIERLLGKHDYRALIIFVGNDISGEPNQVDRSPEEVLALFQLLVHQVRQSRANMTIFMVSITPTPKRFHLWSQISRANQLMRDYCQSQPNLHFINTVPAYLDEDGRPKAQLFTDDRLHQNQSGYDTWSKIIKESLKSKLESLADK
jgi:lysophospholipase L1-like esterase